MCLAIPGKLLQVRPQDGLPMGKVQFGGISKDVCLAYVPEARVGDYVLVHAGFAIGVVDPAEAERTFEYVRQIGELPELQPRPQAGSACGPNGRAEPAP